MKRPRRVLTPGQMGAVDKATIEAGIPGIVLMESAAQRVVEYLAERYAPLSSHSITVVCGKGNNGGDGLAIARQLQSAFQPRALHVLVVAAPEELTGDAAQNLVMLRASGLREQRVVSAAMQTSSLVIDAVLGTGLQGPARGEAREAIRAINGQFPLAEVIAVDIPSGLSGGSADIPGEYVRADATVTFTAPKMCHVLPPASRKMGTLRVAGIGSAAELYEEDAAIRLGWITPEFISPLFAPRAREGNKGSYGHVLIVAGSRGKAGAAAMAGMAALRAGAGLVTVAAPACILDTVAVMCPELMTEPLEETSSGAIAKGALDRVLELATARTVTAMGPGMGTADETRTLVDAVFHNLQRPLVVDADGLNCLAGTRWSGGKAPRVLTPHPGEMSRLTGRDVAAIQLDRVECARELATERGVCVVLKGEGTVIAWPDGEVWINPTGSPAMATGGTGDILTGLLAGLLAQASADAPRAIAGAVYLHGRAGELAAKQLGEQAVIATDLLRYLAEGIRGITHVHNPL